ncbi:MAG: histidine kinase [Flavobacteriales bacterium]
MSGTGIVEVDVARSARVGACVLSAPARSWFFCALLLLCSNSLLHAQWGLPSTRDSLIRLLDPAVEDTLQLYHLDLIAMSLTLSKRAAPYLERMDRLTRKLTQDADPRTRKVATWYRARFYYHSAYHAKFERDIPMSLNYFREARTLYTQVTDTINVASSIDAMGVLFRALGQHQRSIALHQEALDLIRLRAEPAPHFEHMALVHMAEVYTDLGDYAVSEALLASCPAIKEFRHRISRARAHMAERQGDRTRAVELLEQALMETAFTGNAWDSVTVLAPLARARLNDGDLPGAISSADECARLSHRLGDEAACIGCLVISGEAHMLAKDLAAAERDLRRALDMAEEFRYIGLFRESGDDGSMLRATEMLKNLYRAQGRLPEAMAMTDRWVALKDTLARMDGRVDVLQFEMREELFADSLKNAEATRLAEVAHQRSLEAERYRRKIVVLVSCIGLAVLVSLTYAGVRRRVQERKLAALEVQRLQQENLIADLRIRDQVARDMHDDLGSGLSALKLRSELAVERENDPAKREQLSTVADAAGELVGSMRQIVWALNASGATLAEVVAYLIDHARNACAEHGLGFEATTDDAWPERSLSTEQRRNILLVVKEALHNVTKHAHATRVTLNVRWEQALVVEIVDDGVGYDAKASRPQGNGLRNMAKRAEMLGGSLRMNGAQGTRISLLVPVAGTDA